MGKLDKARDVLWELDSEDILTRARALLGGGGGARALKAAPATAVRKSFTRKRAHGWRMLKHSPGGHGHRQKNHAGTSRGLAAAKHADLMKKADGITNDMKAAAADAGMELTGLEFRVKGKKSLADKIRRYRDEDPDRNGVVDFRDEMLGMKKVKDGVRYTALAGEKTYAQDVGKMEKALKARGFERVEQRNFWVSGDGSYRGINSNWRHKTTGEIIELQFHTRASWNMKMRNHELYGQQRRLPETHPRRKALSDAMARGWANVAIPSGVAELAGAF